MSTKEREPLLSENDLYDRGKELYPDDDQFTWRQAYTNGMVRTRSTYEAARAKDAEEIEGLRAEVDRLQALNHFRLEELIQMAVDACTDQHKMSLATKFLDAAKAAGFTPST